MKMRIVLWYGIWVRVKQGRRCTRPVQAMGIAAACLLGLGFLHVSVRAADLPEIIWVMPNSGESGHLAFSPDGRRLAYGRKGLVGVARNPFAGPVLDEDRPLLTCTGSLDTTFNAGSGVLTAEGSAYQTELDQILVGVNFHSFNALPHSYLVRLHGDPGGPGQGAWTPAGTACFDGVKVSITGTGGCPRYLPSRSRF